MATRKVNLVSAFDKGFRQATSLVAAEKEGSRFGVRVLRDTLGVPSKSDELPSGAAHKALRDYVASLDSQDTDGDVELVAMSLPDGEDTDSAELS